MWAPQRDVPVLSSSSADPVGMPSTATGLPGRATLPASKSDRVERATDWIAE